MSCNLKPKGHHFGSDIFHKQKRVTGIYACNSFLSIQLNLKIPPTKTNETDIEPISIDKASGFCYLFMVPISFARHAPHCHLA